MWTRKRKNGKKGILFKSLSTELFYTQFQFAYLIQGHGAQLPLGSTANQGQHPKTDNFSW